MKKRKQVIKTCKEKKFKKFKTVGISEKVKKKRRKSSLSSVQLSVYYKWRPSQQRRRRLLTHGRQQVLTATATIEVQERQEIEMILGRHRRQHGRNVQTAAAARVILILWQQVVLVIVARV